MVDVYQANHLHGMSENIIGAIMARHVQQTGTEREISTFPIAIDELIGIWGKLAEAALREADDWLALHLGPQPNACRIFFFLLRSMQLGVFGGNDNSLKQNRKTSRLTVANEMIKLIFLSCYFTAEPTFLSLGSR